jgi:hypothetical protein
LRANQPLLVLAAPKRALKVIPIAFFLRSTSRHISRNENDSTREPAKTTSVRQTGQRFFAQSGKVLNLCTDSKRRTIVIFRQFTQNKFIKNLRWHAAEVNFRTTAPRYADK